MGTVAFVAVACSKGSSGCSGTSSSHPLNIAAAGFVGSRAVGWRKEAFGEGAAEGQGEGHMVQCVAPMAPLLAPLELAMEPHETTRPSPAAAQAVVLSVKVGEAVLGGAVVGGVACMEVVVPQPMKVPVSLIPKGPPAVPATTGMVEEMVAVVWEKGALRALGHAAGAAAVPKADEGTVAVGAPRWLALCGLADTVALPRRVELPVGLGVAEGNALGGSMMEALGVAEALSMAVYAAGMGGDAVALADVLKWVAVGDVRSARAYLKSSIRMRGRICTSKTNTWQRFDPMSNRSSEEARSVAKPTDTKKRW